MPENPKQDNQKQEKKENPYGPIVDTRSHSLGVNNVQTFDVDDEEPNEMKFPAVKAQFELSDNDLENKSELGSGEFGTVYKTEISNQEHMNKFIEMKLADKGQKNVVIKEAQSEVLPEEINREAAIAEHLRSRYAVSGSEYPSPVALFTYGTFNGSPALFGKFEGGGEILKHIASSPSDHTGRRLFNFMKQLMESLEFLRKHNIVHGDIAPRNILISDDGRALIGDYGLARGVKDPSESISVRYQNKIPALEADYRTIERGKISVATDLYMLKVTIFRIAAQEALRNNLAIYEGKKDLIFAQEHGLKENDKILSRFKEVLIEARDDIAQGKDEAFEGQQQSLRQVATLFKTFEDFFRGIDFADPVEEVNYYHEKFTNASKEYEKHLAKENQLGQQRKIETHTVHSPQQVNPYIGVPKQPKPTSGYLGFNFSPGQTSAPNQFNPQVEKNIRDTPGYLDVQNIKQNINESLKKTKESAITSRVQAFSSPAQTNPNSLKSKIEIRQGFVSDKKAFFEKVPEQKKDIAEKPSTQKVSKARELFESKKTEAKSKEEKVTDTPPPRRPGNY